MVEAPEILNLRDLQLQICKLPQPSSRNGGMMAVFESLGKGAPGTVLDPQMTYPSPGVLEHV